MTEPSDLWDKIKALQKRPDGTDANFVPEHSLRDLFRNLDAQLKDLLADHLNASRASDHIAELVTFICEQAPKAFATLVFSDRERFIIHFFNNKLDDALLPVSRDTAGKLVSFPAEAKVKLAEMAVRLANEEASRIHDVDLEAKKGARAHVIRASQHADEARAAAAVAASKVAATFAGWDPREISYFCDEYQWRFLAPVFDDRANFYHIFDYRVEMPFWPSGDRGQVLARGTGGHPWVAVKVYKHGRFTNDMEFEKVVQGEAEVLNVMRLLEHPHLIRAVAYYRKGQSHCFVFPWADLGNLRDYWEQSNLAANPEKRLAKGYLWWVFVQLHDLASAITLLHSRLMRHGNLKPENILCFRGNADRQPDGSCMLVIADAGLAGVNYQITQLRTEASLGSKGSTLMYGPPEAEAGSREPRSRRYDVWSMGCICLEFLIWLVDGWEGLKDFRADLGQFGRFYQPHWPKGQQRPTGVGRQPEVDRRIAMLRAHPFSQGKRNPLGRLIELIDTKLLVHGLGVRIRLQQSPSTLQVGDGGAAAIRSAPAGRRAITRSGLMDTAGDVFELPPRRRVDSDTMLAEFSEILADKSSFELPSSALNSSAAAESASPSPVASPPRPGQSLGEPGAD
ncbi:serine/threonine protein kinase [Magnaporthiopsis poae ATCC 64411]|uniref:Serine/threonine protein kinase n=1 Tax=Magnaporthiopsis poae (strain ATCC 64411 / 73-15) TaxID=644358 RepID=A0A0C4DZT9_MAGP6|nr:serine/threonine protein kinase [Magnaporthiopsis poae ATCC 64411]